MPSLAVVVFDDLEAEALSGCDDEDVVVVVEIPRGSRNKYEQAADGVVWFDRRLGGPVAFPGDYGYVQGTIGEDGDALDALVLLDESTFPGVHIRCRVIGAFVLQNDGAVETKLLCVPTTDRRQDHLRDLSDLPDEQRRELDAFFESYRTLEPGELRVQEHQDSSAARDVVRRARKSASPSRQ